MSHVTYRYQVIKEERVQMKIEAQAETVTAVERERERERERESYSLFNVEFVYSNKWRINLHF